MEAGENSWGENIAKAADKSTCFKVWPTHFSECAISITMANIQYVLAAWIIPFTFIQALQRSIVLKLKKKRKSQLHYHIFRNFQVQLKNKAIYMWVKRSWNSYGIHLHCTSLSTTLLYRGKIPNPTPSKEKEIKEGEMLVQYSDLIWGSKTDQLPDFPLTYGLDQLSVLHYTWQVSKTNKQNWLLNRACP